MINITGLTILDLRLTDSMVKLTQKEMSARRTDDIDFSGIIYLPNYIDNRRFADKMSASSACGMGHI